MLHLALHNCRQLVVNPQGQGANLRVRIRLVDGNDNLFLAEGDGLDRRDDGSGARAKRFEQSVLATGRADLVHGDDALFHLDLAKGTNEVEDRGTRHARQHQAVLERRCDERRLAGALVGDQHEQVHGANLCQLVVLAVQPKNLRVALGTRLLLRHDGGPVVGTDLEGAGAAGCRADVARLGVQRDGRKTRRIVSTDWREDDEDHVAVGGGNAEVAGGGDGGGANVEGVAGRVWHPARVDLDEFANALK
mmetsp:Transcript_2165/g.6846  ORF Transcript_2165/g.6846 Transcript_2165/m.6846 type:complete len:249 (+) Transcript_2165:142-888(+)